MKTWCFEALFVGVVLLLVAALSGGTIVEFVGAVAVLLAFMHGQVSDRLAERQVLKPTVECYRKLLWYWCLKEALWVAYFIAHESYSALAGAGIFIAYPIWRRWWRKRHPLKRRFMVPGGTMSREPNIGSGRTAGDLMHRRGE